jgi:hypothetical protein
MMPDPLHSRNGGVGRSRRCVRCSKPLPRRARSDAKYCTNECRVAHWHRRRRTARALTRKLKCESCGERLAVTRRADAVYCSTVCRQEGYRRRKRKAAAAVPRKAHQRVIREQLAAADTAPKAADISKATVRPITMGEAKAVIMQYEWLGTMPACTLYSFGIFFGERCGGAVVYAAEPTENLGVWDRYGFTNKIIALARGACLPWAHPHSASKLIRRSMDLLPARYEVVTASVDGLAGEVGTVYQAAGFLYVGVMRPGSRALVRINGKHVSERTAYKLAGTRGVRKLAQRGFDAVPVSRRARYFAFRGSKHDQRRNRAAIADLIRPYPKRGLANEPPPRPAVAVDRARSAAI